MEDGQHHKDLVFIIQARMKSTRLPGKILLPLPIGADTPILGRIIETLKFSKTNCDIIIATSTNTENDVIEKYCQFQGVKCYRGSENNVLSRFIEIIELGAYKNVIRLTADNPIVILPEIEKAYTEHSKGGFDYTYSKGLPIGTNFEIIKAKSLLSLKYKKLTSIDIEHVTHYIVNSNEYTKKKINFLENLEKLRLTIDYPEDYALLSLIFLLKEKNKNLSGLELIKECLINYPWFFTINKSQIQKKQFRNEKDEYNYVIKLLKELELNQALKIFKNHKS